MLYHHEARRPKPLNTEAFIFCESLVMKPGDTSVSLRAALLSDSQERASQKARPRSGKHGAATAEMGCVHSPRISTDVGLWASRRLAGVSGHRVTGLAHSQRGPREPWFRTPAVCWSFVFCLFITILRFPNLDVMI